MFSAPPSLEAFLGKNISNICSFDLGKDDSKNHCAHFVSHMMDYEFGETCKNQTALEKQKEGEGATIRVDRLFNACPENGRWADRPAHLMSCLIFVTISSNVSTYGAGYLMKDNKRKHVGIFINGQVWHYGNTNDAVLCDTEKMFAQKFTRAYKTAGQTVEFYYGRFLR